MCDSRSPARPGCKQGDHRRITARERPAPSASQSPTMALLKPSPIPACSTAQPPARPPLLAIRVSDPESLIPDRLAHPIGWHAPPDPEALLDPSRSHHGRRTGRSLVM